MADQEIEAIIDRAERECARTRQLVREVSQTRVESEIEGGAGVVVVSGYGVLLDIELNPATLRYASPARLSHHIVRAVHDAEAKAQRLRESRLDDRPSMR